MSAYNDFIEDLANALGKEAAQDAIDKGAPIGDSNPVSDIEAQAREFADAIKKWLRALAGDESFVKKPGGS